MLRSPFGADDDCCSCHVIVYRISKIESTQNTIATNAIAEITIFRVAILKSRESRVLRFGVFTIAPELLKFGTKQKPRRPRRRNNFHLKTYICALLYRVYKGKESFSVL